MEEEERRGGRLGLTVDMTTGVLLVEMTALSREEQTSNKLFKKNFRQGEDAEGETPNEEKVMVL